MPKIGNSIDNGMLYTIQHTNYVAIFNLFTTLTYSNYNPDHLASCEGNANKISLQLFMSYLARRNVNQNRTWTTFAHSFLFTPLLTPHASQLVAPAWNL